jgi:hypothetical protein
MNLIPRYGCRHISKCISVLFSTIVVLMFGSQFCYAEDVTLQWDPSPSAGAVGYKVHIIAVKKADHSVIDVGKVTSHVVRGLSKDEDYIFSVTAYDTAGSESVDSNIVHWRSPQTGILAEDALVLKQFCDRHLTTNRIGRSIIRVCEWISPPLADLYQRSDTFRVTAKWILASLAFILKHPLRFAAVVTITTVAGLGIMFYRRSKRKALPSSTGNSS